MLNHVKKGLERTYDRYDLEEEKRASFLKWETEIAGIAWRAGLAGKLGVPTCNRNAALAPVPANDAAGFPTPSGAVSTGGEVEQPGRSPLLRAGFPLSSSFQLGPDI